MTATITIVSFIHINEFSNNFEFLNLRVINSKDEGGSNWICLDFLDLCITKIHKLTIQVVPDNVDDGKMTKLTLH